MTAKATEYSVRDASGRVLCHAPSAIKRNLDSARKRAMREGFARMVEAAGYGATAMVSRPTVKDPENKALELVGDVADALTGARLPFADGTDGGKRLDVVERGHVISDEHNGATCPCNLIPEQRSTNKAHGKADIDTRYLRADPRTAWFDVWMTHYARPSQRRVAVRP